MGVTGTDGPRSQDHHLAGDNPARQDVDQLEACDWSGITDPVERRKRQNRLHQRAWRRRQAALREAARRKPEPGLQVVVFDGESNSFTPSSFSSSSSPDSTSSAALVLRFSSCEGQGPKLVAPLIPYRSAEDVRRAKPVPPINFPLSPDHHLITLIQYNVARAMLTNVTILSLQDILPQECSGTFVIETHPVPPNFKIPPCLQPTSVQLTVPHGRHIDIIPCPVLRDNLILQEGTYDEDNLCTDLVGGLYEGFDSIDVTGIMVWTNPWTVEGWELTEGFSNKWGSLLKGCHDLVRSTNRWRALRGLDPLDIKV